MPHFFYIIIFIALFASSISRKINLNPANHGNYTTPIAVFRNNDHVKINNKTNAWHINPISQDGFDLFLRMNQPWSFDPLVQSDIIIRIDGSTPEATRQDGEFLMVFHVNQKYFSVVIRLDEARGAWKYFPSILANDGKFASSNDDIYDNLIRGQSTISRWNRVSNNDQWTNMRPAYKEKMEWPLIIKLRNNPTDSSFVYQCEVNNVILKTEFADSFDGNTQIDVYIMNDADDDKPFDIYSIEVENSKVEEEEESVISTTTTTTASTTMMLDIPKIVTRATTSTTISNTLSEASVGPTIFDGDESSTMNVLNEDEIRTIGGNNNDKLGLMIGIVVGCVCLSIIIVVCIWYFFTRLEEKEHIHSYHDVVKGDIMEKNKKEQYDP